MIKKKLYILLLLFSVHCFSQKNEIGIFLGGTNYIGDVGPTRYLDPGRYGGEKVEFGTKNSAFGIFYRKNFNNRIAARINFNYANIGSNDNWTGSASYRKERGKSFKNKISAEFGLGIDFNFFEFDLTEDSFQMTPYIHTGIVYLRHNALHYPNGINVARKYGETSSLAIPITIGYKIKPLRDLIVGFEISAKHTFTDNLDGSYPQYKEMEIYSQKAFGSNLSQDWYVFTGITLSYTFGFEPCYCPN
jgi:hypothetical protein